MSTISLTRIEGAIAMPRLRPLCEVPASFGRDWALRPPARHWRAELEALYAAVLHTFCLTDQALLSLCKWVPRDTRRAVSGMAVSASISGLASASALVSASRDETSVERNAHVVADGAVRSTTIAAPVYLRSRGLPVYRLALAGGACVVGGVAVLAWIALGHSDAHRNTGSTLTPVDMPVVSHRPGAELRPRTEAEVKTQVTTAPHVRATEHRAPLAQVDEKPVAAPDRVIPAAPVPVQEKVSAQRKIERHEAARHNVKRHSARTMPARVAATRHGMSRHTAPQATRREPTPSVAGHYSPLAPPNLGIDEYASVTMSAATHLRKLATAPDAAGSDWVGFMSQRRVTEVPEQFSK